MGYGLSKETEPKKIVGVSPTNLGWEITQKLSFFLFGCGASGPFPQSFIFVS